MNEQTAVINADCAMYGGFLREVDYLPARAVEAELRRRGVLEERKPKTQEESEGVPF
jgi:hypothetical protein